MRKLAMVLALVAGCLCEPASHAPSVCVERGAQSPADACDALGNALSVPALRCGEFACPYPADASGVDPDANTECILGVLAREDSGASCDDIRAWLESCGACL